MDGNVSLYDTKDFGNVLKFHLLLGPACNMRCRHCSQTADKRVDLFGGPLSPKVWELIRNYVSYSVGNPSEDLFVKKRRLIFWGGEALLHWDTIRDVVSRTEREFGFTFHKNFRFTIVSNGILLTEDKVRFINGKKIGFCFSYDAPHPFAVRDYVPESVCGLVRKIRGYCVHASVNAINDDPLTAYRCLKTKFPDADDIDVNPKLTQAEGIPKDTYDWDWDAVRRGVRRIRIAAQLGDVFARDLILRYYLCTGDPSGVPMGRANGACVYGNNFMNCTLNGKVLACYNSFKQIGTVDDSMETLRTRSRERLDSMASPDCRDCRHLDVCGGNRCFVNAQDKNNRFYACHNYWLRFYDILKEEMSVIDRPLSDIDREWYAGQERVIDAQVKEFMAEYGG